MTFQATLLAAALALVPAFARADEAKKTDTRSQSNPAMDTRNTTNTADQSDHAQPPSQAGKMDRTAMDHESMEHKKLTDDQVIRKLHHVNQEEIKAGQLAQQKGSTQDVKDYGATLVRDHTKGDQNLKALASKMNVDLEAMKHDQRHQEKQQVHENKMEQLQKMSGKDFDRGFAQMMVNGHRQAIDMVKDARGDAKPELKAMLDQLLPTLQRHEDMANDILNKAGNTASSR